MSISTETERRIRDIVRQSREGQAGTHQSAWWIAGDEFEKLVYVVGKRKLKMYLAHYGKSIKSQSVLLGETSSDNAQAYADLAEILEQAKAQHTVQSYRDYMGTTKHFVPAQKGE